MKDWMKKILELEEVQFSRGLVELHEIELEKIMEASYGVGMSQSASPPDNNSSILPPTPCQPIVPVNGSQYQ